VSAPFDTSDALFRQSVVGASEVAALFDQSPWLTRFELYHRKVGSIAVPEFNAVIDGTPENERIYFGVKLEPVIIDAACERWGYQRQDTPKRLDNGAGLGGHPDALVACPERGAGILEVKTADWLVAKKWGDEPPAHYLLQSQAYQGLAGVTWGDMIVLVGGNQLLRFQYDFRPKLYAGIERRVAEFWDDVRAGREPAVDYARDGAALVEAIGAPDETLADLRDNLDAEQEALDWIAARRRRDEAITDMDAAKARLIERIGAAGTALLPGHRIGCGQTKDTPDREAKPGEIIKGRRGYRRFDVREIA
jgi:predicted phage-related endonuclease